MVREFLGQFALELQVTLELLPVPLFAEVVGVSAVQLEPQLVDLVLVQIQLVLVVGYFVQQAGDVGVNFLLIS